MRNIYLFILSGLFVALSGEVLVKLLIEHDPSDFFAVSLFLNTFFIFVVFLCLEKLSIAVSRKLDIYYVTAFTLGISFEWFALGNIPGTITILNLFGMFLYWTTMVLAPAYFIRTEKTDRNKILTLFFSMMILGTIADLAFLSSGLRGTILWVVLFLAYATSACITLKKLIAVRLIQKTTLALVVTLFLAANIGFLLIKGLPLLKLFVH